jgi:hypothetical protein
MKIAVRANQTQKEIFLQKTIPAGAEIKWLDENDMIEETDAIFISIFYMISIILKRIFL